MIVILRRWKGWENTPRMEVRWTASCKVMGPSIVVGLHAGAYHLPGTGDDRALAERSPRPSGPWPGPSIVRRSETVENMGEKWSE